MKRIVLILLLSSILIPVTAENMQINSPDGNLLVNIHLNNGTITYTLRYKKKIVLEDSPLGLITNVSDFSSNLMLVETNEATIQYSYQEPKIKRSRVEYLANEMTCTYETA